MNVCYKVIFWHVGHSFKHIFPDAKVASKEIVPQDMKPFCDIAFIQFHMMMMCDILFRLPVNSGYH